MSGLFYFVSDIREVSAFSPGSTLTRKHPDVAIALLCDRRQSLPPIRLTYTRVSWRPSTVLVEIVRQIHASKSRLDIASRSAANETTERSRSQSVIATPASPAVHRHRLPFDAQPANYLGGTRHNLRQGVDCRDFPGGHRRRSRRNEAKPGKRLLQDSGPLRKSGSAEGAAFHLAGALAKSEQLVGGGVHSLH